MCDGHRERLRERYRRAGFNAFAEYELLELLLFYALPRRDTKAIARKLLERFGSLSAVIAATPAELKTVEGVGEKTAAFLCLVGEIDRRAALAERERTPMNTRGAVAEYCYHLLRGRKSECVYALLFDARFNLIAARLIAEGLPDRVALLPRRVPKRRWRTRRSTWCSRTITPRGTARPRPRTAPPPSGCARRFLRWAFRFRNTSL